MTKTKQATWGQKTSLPHMIDFFSRVWGPVHLWEPVSLHTNPVSMHMWRSDQNISLPGKMSIATTHVNRRRQTVVYILQYVFFCLFRILSVYFAAASSPSTCWRIYLFKRQQQLTKQKQYNCKYKYMHQNLFLPLRWNLSVKTGS